jgi:hypothetical protein
MNSSDIAARGRVKILLVDDDLDLRETFIVALDPIRFRAHVAEGVHAAVMLAARHHFDAVVCGKIETAAALRERLGLTGIPILVFIDDPSVPGDLATRVLARPTKAGDLTNALAAALGVES